ncbi:MAG TPA: hypothetical protein VL126_13905 [Bacteroidota bacterium]|nr:hypothetical protein [Bacteroidota bacterium]
MKKLIVIFLLAGAVLASPPRPWAQTKATETKAPVVKKGGSPGDPAVGKTAEGKTVYEGARSGHYWMSEKGEKIYVQEFIGAKILGKTKDGKIIYLGFRGGKFYYSDKGDKVYLKK